MMRHMWSGRSAAVVGCLIFCSGAGLAQSRSYVPASTPNVVVTQDVQPATPFLPASRAAEAPVSPATSPGPLSLDECLSLGMQHQPAIDAAQASLNAALSGQRSLNRLIVPRLFTPDYKVRVKQACHGVTIASAGLSQAEWETRYSITRNFFTVQYIRSQDVVVSETLRDLQKGYDRANKLFKAGDPDVKITAVDLDAIQVQIAIIKGKKSQIDNGMEKALAALREAMGLNYDYPLEIAKVDLPPAVYETKKFVTEKDDKGKVVKKEVAEYQVLYPLHSKKAGLIASAIASRPEMTQAATANVITDLEVQAQNRIRGWRGQTFAIGADIHAKPIPMGIFNNEYRPGAIGLEMPPMLVGRMKDRMTRAGDFNQRAMAVVDKTTNLISLDVEAQYLKWQEAVEEVRDLSDILTVAKGLPQRVLDLNPKDYTSSAVIQANMTSIMVRSQLNEAKHMHALALAGLERATAGAFNVYPVPEPPLPMPKKN